MLRASVTWLGVFALWAGAASATPMPAPPGEASLYEIYNHIYGTSFTSNSDLDALEQTESGLDWDLAGATGTLTAWAHFASYSADLGIYTTDGAGNIQTQSEVIGNITEQGLLNPADYTADFAVNGTFGFYDEVGSTTWYSEAPRNWLDSGGDHLRVYQGQNANELVLAWEDMPLDLADLDYNDVVATVYLGSKHVMPEPSSMVLLGIGIAGLATYRLRQNSSLIKSQHK